MPLGSLLAAIAIAAVVLTFVPKYKASYLLEVNQDFLVFDDVMPGIQQLARTEKQIILNAVVIDTVLGDPDVRATESLAEAANPEAELRENLSISSPGTDTQMVVSYIDSDPEAAAMICNTVVEAYLEKRLSLDTARLNNLERWLGPEIERWKAEVAKKQEIVQSASKANLGYDLGNQVVITDANSDGAVLADLRSEINRLQLDLVVMDKIKLLPPSEDDDAENDEEVVIDLVRIEPTEENIVAFVSNDEAVRDAAAEVIRYEDRMREMEDEDLVRINRERYLEYKAKVKEWNEKFEKARSEARAKAKEELDKLADADLERRKTEARNQIAEQKAERQARRYQAYEAELAKRKEERSRLQARIEFLESQYQQQLAQAKLRQEQQGSSAARLQFAKSDLKSATEVLTKLQDRQAAISTERQTIGAVRTVARAQQPKTPMALFPLIKMAGAGGVAFMIPFVLGLLWELRIQRLTDCAAVEKSGLLAPVVGEISKVPAKQAPRHRRYFEESIDALRANLCLSIDTKHARSIAVTSSMSGEGKSSVASQLAISIAKAKGEPVLLIDADLRSPDQHDIFGLENGEGVCGLVAGEVDLEGAIDKSLGDLVHVLPAGRLNQNPHRILNSESVAELVSQATEMYGHVIIDTAPVLSASESLAISAAVDATLVCVMRDLSRLDNVTRTTRRLEAAGATIAGTVFSGVPTRAYVTRYGDYSYALSDDVDA